MKTTAPEENHAGENATLGSPCSLKRKIFTEHRFCDERRTAKLHSSTPLTRLRQPAQVHQWLDASRRAVNFSPCAAPNPTGKHPPASATRPRAPTPIYSRCLTFEPVWLDPTRAMSRKNHIGVHELPAEKRAPLSRWLHRQACPILPGGPDNGEFKPTFHAPAPLTPAPVPAPRKRCSVWRDCKGHAPLQD